MARDIDAKEVDIVRVGRTIDDERQWQSAENKIWNGVRTESIKSVIVPVGSTGRVIFREWERNREVPRSAM